MTIANIACRIGATWSFGVTPPGHYGGREPYRPPPRLGDPPPPDGWAAEFARRRPPWWERFDRLPEAENEALVAALRPWVDGRMPLIVDPAGVRLARNVPLLLDHRGPAIAVNLAVTRAGDLFTAAGWVAPGDADALRARGHASVGVTHRAARIVDERALKFVSSTSCLLREVSATADPVDRESTLSVGPPERVPESDLEQLMSFASYSASEQLLLPTRFVVG